jgi:hypothetical protein
VNIEQNIEEQVELASLILRPERFGLDERDNEEMLDQAERLAQLVLDLDRARRMEHSGDEGDDPIDLTLRFPGIRGKHGLAGKLDELFRGAGIDTVSDTLQHNSESIRRRPPIIDQGNLASTARPVLPMPEIDQGKLTFGAVLSLLADLLSVRSRGVHKRITFQTSSSTRYSSPTRMRTEKSPLDQVSASTSMDGI